MFFKAHFSALQHGKKENHRPKEVYLKAVSWLHQRNFTETFSAGIERGIGRNDSHYHSFQSLSGY